MRVHTNADGGTCTVRRHMTSASSGGRKSATSARKHIQQKQLTECAPSPAIFAFCAVSLVVFRCGGADSTVRGRSAEPTSGGSHVLTSSRTFYRFYGFEPAGRQTGHGRTHHRTQDTRTSSDRQKLSRLSPHPSSKLPSFQHHMLFSLHVSSPREKNGDTSTRLIAG